MEKNHENICMNDDDAIIRVGTWEELESLSGYVSVIDESGVTLGRFRGKYAMKAQPMRPCAIKQCRTKHREGAVVSLTDGSKTNIGHRCGRKYFPDQWDTLYKEFAVRERAAQRVILFTTLRQEATEMREAVAALRPRIDAYKKRLEDFILKVPRAVREELYRRAERGEINIVRVRAQTKEEREADSVSGLRLNKAAVAEDVLGTLIGLSVLNPRNDPWQIANYEIEGRCKKVFALKSSESIAFKLTAQTWSDAPSAFVRLKRGLELGDALFSDANLRSLALLPSAALARLVSVRRAEDGGIKVELRPRYIKP
jgi:hypothetical protein